MVPSSPLLAQREHQLATDVIGAQDRLAVAMEGVAEGYDDVFIDCPPSLGLLTVNALFAADRVVIVAEPAAWSLDGVEQILRNVRRIAERRDDRPSVAGIVVNRLARTRDAGYWYEQLQESHRDLVVQPAIRLRAAVAEAAAQSMPIHALTRDGAADAAAEFDALSTALDPDPAAPSAPPIPSGSSDALSPDPAPVDPSVPEPVPTEPPVANGDAVPNGQTGPQRHRGRQRRPPDRPHPLTRSGRDHSGGSDHRWRPLMPYDPKRPRPVVDRDEPAPVDALIETVVPDPVEPGPAPIEAAPDESAPGPETVESAPDPVVVTPDPVVVSAEPEPEDAPDATARPEPIAVRPPTTSSDVPVAPAPVAPTANRAVMFVMFGAGLVTLLVLILLRRRQR